LEELRAVGSICGQFGDVSVKVGFTSKTQEREVKLRKRELKHVNLVVKGVDDSDFNIAIGVGAILEFPQPLAYFLVTVGWR
jgi:hypothetical protein